MSRRRKAITQHDESTWQCARWVESVNAAIFIMFALSFFKPQTSRDWRSFGAFSAFIVAFVPTLKRTSNATQ